MLDWVYPGRVNEAGRRKLRSSNILLEIASHIANGSKHFVAEDPRHQSVNHCDVDYTSNIGLGTGAGRLIERVYVRLEGQAAIQFGPTMTADDLAGRIVSFWEQYLASNPGAP